MTAASPVLAAGAVCWRVVDGKPRILLVHRAAHADVSLPKGKLDPGETLPQTAKRELLEETGLTVALGAPLGTVEYTLPSGRENGKKKLKTKNAVKREQFNREERERGTERESLSLKY